MMSLSGGVSTETVLVAVSAMAIVTGVVSLVIAAGRRKAAGGRPLAALCAATVGWMITYTAELTATDVATKLAWIEAGWIPAAIAPVCWFLFALEYSGRDRYVTRETVALLLVVPAVSIALLWTNDVHGLVLSGYETTAYGTLRVVDWEYGPVYWATVGYSYVLVLAGALLIGETAAESLDVYRFQSVALITAAVTPLVASVGSVGLGVIPVDATPFAFAVSDALCVIALTRLSLLDARPVPGHLARGTIIESLADAIFVADVRGYVTDANPAGATVLGRPRKALIGQRLGSLHPDLAPDPANQREVHDVELGDDETRYFDVQFTPLIDGGGRVAGRIVSLRDVTERRLHLQQLSVLNRVLRHDLRTRTNLVLGYADMATDAVTDGRTADALTALETVRSNALALVDAGEKVRTAERLISDGAKHRTDTVEALVTDAVESVREEWPGFECDVTHGAAGARVPAILGVVIRNLVENAVEHNPADRPWVSVETASTPERITVTVADDGPGIAAQHLDVLEGEESALRHGNGVGLWLVNWGVDAVGGRVDFRDRPGGGTVVEVEVPRLD